MKEKEKESKYSEEGGMESKLEMKREKYTKEKLEGRRVTLKMAPT